MAGINPDTGPEIRPSSIKDREKEFALMQNLKGFYEKLRPKDISNARFSDYTELLKKHSDELPVPQKKFLSEVIKLERAVTVLASRSFSYNDAIKTAKNPAEKGIFDAYERQVDMIRNVATPRPLPVRSEVLFSALSESDFDRLLSDKHIVPEAYQKNAIFKGRARAVFYFIQRQRSKSVAENTDATNKYLDYVLEASDLDDVEKRMKSDKVKIPIDSVSKTTKQDIERMYVNFNNYKKKLNERELLKKQFKTTRSYLDEPRKYLNSVEYFAASNIQKFRGNWENLKGYEKGGFIFLTAYLASKFLSSDNPSVVNLRGALKKVGLGLGVALLANIGSKAFTGRGILEHGDEYAMKKSGELDVVKKGLDVNSNKAADIKLAMRYIGNKDAIDIFGLFEEQRLAYEKNPPPGGLKKQLLVPGLSKDKADPARLYSALEAIDQRLITIGKREGKKLNVRILKDKLEKAYFDAKSKGKAFVRPTLTEIVVSMMDNKDLMIELEKGTVKVSPVEKTRVTLTKNQEDATRNWWPLLAPSWAAQAYLRDRYPKSEVQKDYLTDMLGNKSAMYNLDSFINEKYFHNYTAGFKNAAKQTAQGNVQSYINKDKRHMFIISRVPDINYKSFETRGNAYFAAITNAKSQAEDYVKEYLRKKYGKNAKTEAVLNHIEKFAQVVQATALCPESSSKKLGERKGCAVFTRVALPGSIEHDLRLDDMWTDGNMVEQSQKKPMGSDLLTKTDYELLSKKEKERIVLEKDVKYRSIGKVLSWLGIKLDRYKVTSERVKLEKFTSNYGGAYQSFLARMRLTTNPKDKEKVEKALKFFALEYNDLSKDGFAEFAASHKFSYSRIREAIGLTAGQEIPNANVDINGLVEKNTIEAIAKIPGIKPEDRPDFYSAFMALFGNNFILACNGDKAAREDLQKEDPVLYATLIANTNPDGKVTSAQKAMIEGIVMDNYQKYVIKKAGKKA